jgi:hypothetical protein
MTKLELRKEYIIRTTYVLDLLLRLGTRTVLTIRLGLLLAL